jgi:hypothetical protein
MLLALQPMVIAAWRLSRSWRGAIELFEWDGELAVRACSYHRYKSKLDAITGASARSIFDVIFLGHS